MTIKERVDNGVALLDEYLPEWRTYIDKDALDLSCGLLCIIGQLELWPICNDLDKARKCGFIRELGTDYETEYDSLQKEWLKRL